MSWPAPRPRLEPEPDPPAAPGWRWPWYAAAVLVGVVGGAFGYLAGHPDAGLERLAVAAPPPPAAQPLVSRPIVEGAPAPPAPDTTGIRETLDRWAAALKSGDVDAAAECYAPVVATYFNRHDVPRAAVRQSIRQSRAGNGRLEVYRISGLGITPLGDSRVEATFRKRWLWSGRRRSTGEEQERMTLVRNADGWRISSEQVETR